MADNADDDRIVINSDDLADPLPEEASPEAAAVEDAAPEPVSPSPDTLVISSEDLEEPAPVRPVAPGPPPIPSSGRRTPPRRKPTTRSRVSLCMTAGSTSALIAWGVTEPFLGSDDPPVWVGVLLFGVMAGCMGFALGAVQGLQMRNLRRSLRAGGLAFATATAVALALTAINARWIHQVLITAEVVDMRRVLVRIVAWAGIGAVVGLAQGIPYGSRWKITRGLVGGMSGGAIAGLLFDPLGLLTVPGAVLRLLGLALTGGLTGLGVGLVQEWRRPAWLTVTRSAAGALDGCEFLLHRPTTTIGADPDSDVPLKGDDGVGARHAVVRMTPGGYVVEDLGSPTGTFVNGTLVRRQRLNNADSIQVGAALFVYHERDLTPSGVSYDGAVGTY